MTDRTSTEHWYVAETAPRKEMVALQNLRRQSFHGVCPRFSKVRRHARRTENVLVPYFPGYVFVRFDRERDRWSSINGTLGVRRLIGSRPNAPQAVPNAVVEALLARAAGVGVFPFQPGDEVRVASGPLADQVATIERLADQERVRILMNILGNQTPVIVRAADLVPA